jgi:starch-binding outer membrane protein, SusD/RagB family
VHPVRASLILWSRRAAAAIAFGGVAGCGNLLGVPTSPTLADPTALENRTGAEAIRQGAIFLFEDGLADGNAGQMLMSGLMSDELLNLAGGIQQEPVDQRQLQSSNPTVAYNSDFVMEQLARARLQAELAIPALRKYAPGAPPSEIGEMWAIIGFSEMVFAEDFCNGIPLSDAGPSGHITYGMPLTADSVYGHSIVAFDSALRYAGDSARIAGFAAVGKARALLGRGQYSAASAAVAGIPVTFSYTATIGQVTLSLWDPVQAAPYSMSDFEGGNGLNFISANDPRLMTYQAGVGFDGVTPVIYPAKYPTGDTPIIVADGIEAKLIVAEAALASGDAAGWLDTLNALRTTEGGVTGLGPISDPGTAQSRADTLFTERAFWLFGSGHRMGDLRRLVRQYGRDQATVFPTGAYQGFGGGNYGTSVNFPIPNAERTNPNFKGCLDRKA